MANILIQYPPEFRCFDKFRRKLNKILKNLEYPVLYYVEDEGELIANWLSERPGATAKKFEIDELPVDEVTHAITFIAQDGLFEPLNIEGIPNRTIVVPITRVVNKDRGDEFDVYIGRGTKWGNPYAVGFGQAPGEQADSREEAIRKFAYDFSKGFLGDKHFMKELEKLQGKRLGCHCKPLACHGDVLAEFLNSLDDGA